MKIFILVLAFLVNATHAESTMTRAEYLEFCRLTSDVAAQIMTVRQMGLPMSDAVALVNGERTYEEFIKDAYSTPRRSAPEDQRLAASDFRDQSYLKCFKSIPAEMAG